MATAFVAMLRITTEFPALAEPATLRETSRLRSAPAQTRFANQSTYASPIRALRTLS
jgi:hypothetical protein